MEIRKLFGEIKQSKFVSEVKETVKQHPLITIILLIILVVLINSFAWTTIDGLITTGTLLAVVINTYINAKHNETQLQKIPIYFNEKKLNLDITRKDFSRSELQGILGILRTNMKVQYDIAYLSKIEYLDTIYKIQKSELHELKIEITDDELKQFKDDIYEK